MNNPLFKLNLGDKVADRITGFTGIIVSRSEYINGCIRYGVQSQKTQAGKVMDAEWFDEKQLKLVKAKAVAIEQKATGGPAPIPRQAANPR